MGSYSLLIYLPIPSTADQLVDEIQVVLIQFYSENGEATDGVAQAMEVSNRAAQMFQGVTTTTLLRQLQDELPTRYVQQEGQKETNIRIVSKVAQILYCSATGILGQDRRKEVGAPTVMNPR